MTTVPRTHAGTGAGAGQAGQAGQAAKESEQMKWAMPWAGRRLSPATERSRLQMRAREGLARRAGGLPIGPSEISPTQNRQATSTLDSLGLTWALALCPRIRAGR
jgi:hypothetical protein